MKMLLKIFLSFAALLFFSASVFAHNGSSSSGYIMKDDVQDCAGQTLSSSGYSIISASGQSGAEKITSSGYNLYAGFIRKQLFYKTQTTTPTITKTCTLTVTPTVTQSVTKTITATVTQSITPTVTQTVTQSITLTVTQTNTKTQTMTVTPTVSSTVSVFISATVTLTCTAVNTATVTPTNGQAQITYTVYDKPYMIPNPVTGSTAKVIIPDLNGQAPAFAELTMYSVSGETVLRSGRVKAAANMITIDLSDMADGIYIYTVTAEYAGGVKKRFQPQKTAILRK